MRSAHAWAPIFSRSLEQTGSQQNIKEFPNTVSARGTNPFMSTSQIRKYHSEAEVTCHVTGDLLSSWEPKREI